MPVLAIFSLVMTFLSLREGSQARAQLRQVQALREQAQQDLQNQEIASEHSLEQISATPNYANDVLMIGLVGSFAYMVAKGMHR